MGTRVAVTGASGFIGSQLARTLMREGYAVTALVRPESDLWRIEDLRGEVALTPLEDPKSLDGAEILFHLGAAGVRPGRESGVPVLEANVVGTQRLLEAAHAADVQRVVLSGSCFEYGEGSRLRESDPLRPQTDYAASKAAARLVAEAFARSHGLPVVALLPFTVYGPFESAYRLVASALLSALDGRPLELTGGEQTRDFVYVEDVADAFVAAARAELDTYATFNVCTGDETSVAELATAAVDVTGSDSDLRLGAIPYRDNELWRLSGDPSEAERGLGWNAKTPLREGLQCTAEWLRANRDRYREYQRTEVTA
jgi:nucleoside-diphosphate-sugar epimerase